LDSEAPLSDGEINGEVSLVSVSEDEQRSNALADSDQDEADESPPGEGSGSESPSDSEDESQCSSERESNSEKELRSPVPLDYIMLKDLETDAEHDWTPDNSIVDMLKHGSGKSDTTGRASITLTVVTSWKLAQLQTLREYNELQDSRESIPDFLAQIDAEAFFSDRYFASAAFHYHFFELPSMQPSHIKKVAERLPESHVSGGTAMNVPHYTGIDEPFYEYINTLSHELCEDDVLMKAFLRGDPFVLEYSSTRLRDTEEIVLKAFADGFRGALCYAL